LLKGAGLMNGLVLFTRTCFIATWFLVGTWDDITETKPMFGTKLGTETSSWFYYSLFDTDPILDTESTKIPKCHYLKR
jgi:hypothetical protein